MKSVFAVAAVLLVSMTLVAAPKPKAPAKAPRTVAPEMVPHADAMFLQSLSNDGKTRVVFRATAVGTRFFFEEPSGVSVYLYDGLNYRRDAFLKGSTLDKALKVYRAK